MSDAQTDSRRWDGVTGTITRTRRPAKKTTKPKARKCVWKLITNNEWVYYWSSTCKKSAHWISSDKRQRKCPNCGRKIERKK